MIQLTALAQKLAQGFKVTFQFSDMSPTLLGAAMSAIQATPGSTVTGYASNTIIAHTVLPWELLMHLRGLDNIGGVPFAINFYNWDTVAMASATFDMHPDVLASYMHGRSLLGSHPMN